ncbi:hypothetical protein VNI00_002524 [Paramarasmius palmivorus]|uniref:Uncharacterized protein n=1 Tax=Paramarasmius palmivorus TaxID=297713 RepID=A0AAW0DXZ5_9AGAR
MTPEEIASFRPRITLKGATGPLNAIVFSPDNLHLAAGGDDEMVRIWQIDTATCVQELQATPRNISEQYGWGQVTSLLWTFKDGEVLCVGTARGLVVMYKQSRDSRDPNLLFKTETLQVTEMFDFNDSVECMAVDGDQYAFASHTGHIRLFHFDTTKLTLEAKLELTWAIKRGIPTIPASIQFYGTDLIITWLEAGEM